MQAILARAGETVEPSAAALFAQDAADPTWWDVSLDEGTTWHFFTSGDPSEASVLERFVTVLDGRWDHATADDWMDEGQNEPPIDPAERADHAETMLHLHLEHLEQEAMIAPQIVTVDADTYLAHHDQAFRLLELFEELHARLTAGGPVPQQFLQTVWDASGELTSPTPVLSGNVTDALRATERAMCPHYAGFLWVSCDGPAVIAQRLGLCVRRACAVLLAWLISGAADRLAQRSAATRHDRAELRRCTALLEVAVCAVSGWAAHDSTLRGWGQSAEYLRRQLHKAGRLSSPSANKHTRLAHTAAKFCASSQTGFRLLHEAGYPAFIAASRAQATTAADPGGAGALLQAVDA